MIAKRPTAKPPTQSVGRLFLRGVLCGSVAAASLSFSAIGSAEGPIEKTLRGAEGPTAPLRTPVPPLPRTQSLADYRSPLARILSGELPPFQTPVPAGPQVFYFPDGRPYAILPGFGMFWDFPSHPERYMATREFTLRVIPAAEVLAMLAYGYQRYWADAAINAPDWEFAFTGPSFSQKFYPLSNIRFDTNTYETNTVSHPVAGYFPYLAARGAGLDLFESYMYAFLASALWESVGEYREKISLNDMFFTPWGGPALGEPAHQLGLFFERGEDNIVNNVLALVASPIRYAHRRLGKWFVARSKKLDELGLPADIWHRFDLAFGVGAETGRDGIRLSNRRMGVSTEIIDIPEYDQPGKVLRSIPTGSITSVRASAAVDDSGLHQLDLVTRVLLGGMYEQDIERDPRGGLRGHSIFIGPSTAFNYALHVYDAPEQDKIASTHVIGLSIDGTVYRGKARARIAMDTYADFSAVHSFAIDKWLADNDPEGIKRVLLDKQYYFAAGLTLRPSISISYRRFEIGAQFQEDFFESIEGQDRFQEEVTRDFHLSDRRSGQRAWLSYTLPGDNLKAAWVEVERLDRTGNIGVLRVSRQATDVRAGIALHF